jgi:hypothetical protein
MNLDTLQIERQVGDFILPWQPTSLLYQGAVIAVRDTEIAVIQDKRMSVFNTRNPVYWAGSLGLNQFALEVEDRLALCRVDAGALVMDKFFDSYRRAYRVGDYLYLINPDGLEIYSFVNGSQGG